MISSSSSAFSQRSVALRRLFLVVAGFLAAALAPVGAFAQAAPLAVPEDISPTQGRIFEEGTLIRLPVPEGASERWAVTDDQGRVQREGTLRVNERALYLGDLERGVYYLFWGLGKRETPGLITGPERRASFLVVPDRPAPVEDHYVAVNQPDMVEPLSEGAEPVLSREQRFTIEAMSYLGIRRLRSSFARDRVRKGAGAWDFRQVAKLVDYAELRGVRFIAVLGRSTGGGKADVTAGGNGTGEEAQADADYLRALLRRFGFKFDVFALWPEPNTLSFAGEAYLFVQRVEPVYRVLRARSPYSSISLGGVAPEINDPSGISRSDFMHALFAKGAGLFDVLDICAEGTLEESRAFAMRVDELMRRFIPRVQPSEVSAASRDAVIDQRRQVFKPRAVSNGALSAGEDTIADQRRQAAQIVEKMVWFRHHRYHYFALGAMIDPAGTGASGVDRREDRRGAIGLFSGGEFYPRIAAGAVGEAVQRLAGVRVAEPLRYQSDTVEIYGFERGDETVLAGWAPDIADDLRTEKRMVVEMFWPEEVEGQVYDMLGREVTGERLRNVDEAARIKRLFLVGTEPAWLVVPVRADAIRW